MHLFEPRYKKVWDITKKNKSTSKKNVSSSQYFFEMNQDKKVMIQDGKPIPKHFNTYAIVCCLPFPKSFQILLENLWKEYLSILRNPIAYGVESQNRHVEIFLFQRPEELFTQNEIKKSIELSKSFIKEVIKFSINFRYPFITPDGTIVVPGYDNPEGIIDNMRIQLREHLSVFPRKQSNWLHTSLGRVLETLDEQRLSPLLKKMEEHWNEQIGTAPVDEMLWTWEKQWYMMEKEILYKKIL